MRNQLMKKLNCFLLFAIFPFSIVQADALNSESEVSKANVVNAVWQEHEVRVSYHSFNVYYSCSGIEDSLERILKELGAKDVKARAGACGINDIERSIPIRVKFKALSSDPDAEGPTFNASYEEVDFKQIYGRRTQRSNASNCDLLRAVSTSVSDIFELETLKAQSICNSGYASGNDVKWKVNVLKPAS